MNDSSSPTPLIIMLDTETLALGPNAVIWQAAFMAVPMDAPNPKNYIKAEKFFLPIQPQLDAGRTIEAGTLGFWLKQDNRLDILEAIDGDADELTAYVRSLIRKVATLVDDYPGSEIWSKGAGFDITKLEALFKLCGETAPWHYRQLMDVRTIAYKAGVHTGDVRTDDIVMHDALEDCRLQLRILDKSLQKLGIIADESAPVEGEALVVAD